MKDKSSPFFSGLRDGIPIALGYFAVSFALGITAKKVGLSAPASGLMSALMIASAGEFAALNVIAESAPYLEMVAAMLIINLRYLLLSCSLSQKFSEKTPFFHRFFVGFFVTDEIAGISFAREGHLIPSYVYGAAAISVPAWVAGTVLGVLAGEILPPALSSALGVALYGMFLAIIVPPARKEKFLALLVAVSMLCSFAAERLPVVGSLSSGIRIILLTLLLSAAAALIKPRKEEA